MCHVPDVPVFVVIQTLKFLHSLRCLIFVYVDHNSVEALKVNGQKPNYGATRRSALPLLLLRSVSYPLCRKGEKKENLIIFFLCVCVCTLCKMSLSYTETHGKINNIS